MPEIKTSLPTFSALIVSSVKGNERRIISNRVKHFLPWPWRGLNSVIPYANAALSAPASHEVIAASPSWIISGGDAPEESNQLSRASENPLPAQPCAPRRHRSTKIVRHAP